MTKNRFLMGVAGSVLIVLLSSWGLFRDSFSTKKPNYTHLYCPSCEQEMRYDPAKAGKKCPFCLQSGAENAADLIPAIGGGDSRVLASGTSSTGKLLVLIVIILVVIQVDFLLWYIYRQERRRQEEAYQNRVLICRCPFCQRKIGYSARKIGEGVACPRCKTAFVLPAEDAAASASATAESPPAVS